MNRRGEGLRHKKAWGIAIICVAVLMAGLIMWRVGVPMVRFARDPQKFRAWVDGHGFGGRLAYMGMVILQVIIALIPGEPFEIAAGYAFGALEGTLLCLLASTIGSVIVFGLVRFFGTRLVELFFTEDKLRSVRFLKSTHRRDMIFLIIFMIPGTPKDLLSYVAGLTDIRFGVWLLICSLGRVPSIITSTVGGNALGTKNYWFAAGVFIVTMLISAAGLWVYDRICKKHSKQHNK